MYANPSRRNKGFARFANPLRYVIPALAGLLLGASLASAQPIRVDGHLEDGIQQRGNAAEVTLRTEDQLVVLSAGDALDSKSQPFVVGEVEVGLGKYQNHKVSVSYASNNSCRMAVEGYVLAGSYYGGDRPSSSFNPGIRAKRHVRSDAALAHNDPDYPGYFSGHC